MAGRKDKSDEGAAGPETSLAPINKGRAWEELERLGLNTPRDDPLEEFGRTQKKIGYSLASDAPDAEERAASATVTVSMRLPELQKDVAAGTKRRARNKRAGEASAKARRKKAARTVAGIRYWLSTGRTAAQTATRWDKSESYVREIRKRMRAEKAVNSRQDKPDDGNT